MKQFPRYPRRPHATGLARVVINTKTYYLGKHNSPESHAEYRRLMQEFALGAFDGRPTGAHAGAQPAPERRQTVADLVAMWIADAKRNGFAAKELVQIELAIKPLDRLFGATFADEFTAARLESLRDAMISASWMTDAERAIRKHPGWSRGYTTHQIARIKRLFRWGEARGHIPKGTWEHLKTLGPIARNAKVRTTVKRKPIDFDAQVKPCLKHMPPQVAAMVQVQYLAGMRPGEVVRMRRNEIDTTMVEGVWLYRPASHKGEWRGDELVKVIGPRGQAVLAPWLMAAEPDGYVFPPLRNRYKRGCYEVEGYGRAIARACERAGVERWSAYDLRRGASNLAETVGDISDAAAFLGHRDLETTKIYLSKQNLAKAAAVARLIG